ncbi:hypothetical protein O181_090232 [Austropuccinia psidii MF-1]|uniref:Uncharacterized protein n=1 Tax=Austropuccinia psidii MF-1 TaxID=1389203 RepID=A0A9Q3IV49_9BASI|nr:hypothetical protein [Austropuccinia psidii MF-1]
MMKVFPSGNGPRDPKQADGNDSRQLSLSPHALICPPPLLGHHPMVTSLLYQSKLIIRLMKDGYGKRTFELGLIVTHEIQMPKTKPTKSPPTRLTHSMYASRENPMATHSRSEDLFWEPSQHNEPPIPGLSPSSKPPEDVLTSPPATPRSIIIIDDTPVGSPTPPPSTPTPDLPPIATENPTASSPPVPSSSHSYDDTCQEFNDLRPTLMIPQAIN